MPETDDTTGDLPTEPPERAALRAEVRAFLEAHAEPLLEADPWEVSGFPDEEEAHAYFERGRSWQRTLAEHGWAGLTWPEEYGGRGLPGWAPRIFAEESARFGSHAGFIRASMAMLGPTLLEWGTDEQKRRFLPTMLSGEVAWCQLFSEPGAGSDLAGLAARAVLDGDEFVVDGQKVWNSSAQFCEWGFLLVRTDPDVPKHQGISFLLVDMSSPGIEVRPIHEMTGGRHFNETFLTDVRIPVDRRVGEENEGWRLAKVTLANERVSLSSAGSLWGEGPSADDLLDLVRRDGGIDDPVMRQRLAGLFCEAEVLRLNRLRTLSARLAGRTPGSEASIQKAMADEHGQHVMELAKELAGTSGMLIGSGPPGVLGPSLEEGTTDNLLRTRQFPDVSSIWHYGFIFSPALTLGGGTFAVQRNIIGERVLGLPRDLDVESGKSWAEARAAGRG